MLGSTSCDYGIEKLVDTEELYCIGGHGSDELPKCIDQIVLCRSRCRQKLIRIASRRPPWYVTTTLVHSYCHLILQNILNRRSSLALVMCLWQSRWGARNEPLPAHGKIIVHLLTISDTYSACFTQLRDELRLWRNKTLPPATFCWPSAYGSVVRSDADVDVVSINAFG